MRLLLVGFGRVLLDLALLEAKDDDADEDDPGPGGSCGALAERAERYPLGFHAEPAPDRWPFGDE